MQWLCTTPLIISSVESFVSSGECAHRHQMHRRMNQHLQEVKELANTLIAYVPCVLMYVPGPGSPENARLFGPTAALLAHKTVSAKLHWREAAVAELLFAHVAPCMQDAGALQPIVAAQVHDLLSGSTLIAKVRPRRPALPRRRHSQILSERVQRGCGRSFAAIVSSVQEMGFVALLSTLTIAANPKAPHGDPHRAAALAATSDAFRAHDAWPRSYVATLQAMQSLSASDRVKAFHALEEAPEQAFVVSASSVVTQSRVLEWHPHLCAEPKSTGADGGLSILSVPAVLGTEMLARVVGAPFVDSLREPLEAWAAMDQVRLLPEKVQSVSKGKRVAPRACRDGFRERAGGAQA